MAIFSLITVQMSLIQEWAASGQARWTHSVTSCICVCVVVLSFFVFFLRIRATGVLITCVLSFFFFFCCVFPVFFPRWVFYTGFFPGGFWAETLLCPQLTLYVCYVLFPWHSCVAFALGHSSSSLVFVFVYLSFCVPSVL